jgi:ferrochelatase
MAELIAREIQACPDPSTAHVFFSAHGVPKSYVEEAGDPYQEEIQACAGLIMDRLEQQLGHRNPFTLAYQSRVGPVEWLKPYTDDALHELGEQGVKDLVVVPISFVSEHIETLEEIDIEYREIATEAGITNFRRVPALDTTPSFIEGLANLVQHALEGPEVNLDQAAALPTKVKLYPQDKWAWGWNNSSEVWNGRLAMLGFSAFLLELLSGRGPLHSLGLLYGRTRNPGGWLSASRRSPGRWPLAAGSVSCDRVFGLHEPLWPAHRPFRQPRAPSRP